MSIIKILLFIWPFVKEMVLGDRSVREAAKDNKMKVLLAFILAGSICINIFSVNRLWTLSQEYLDIKKEFAEFKSKQGKVVTAPTPPKSIPLKPSVEKTEPLPVVTIKKPKKEKSKVVQRPSVPVNDTADRYKKLREDFDKIKKREEGGSDFAAQL